MRWRTLNLATLCLLVAACNGNEAESLVERYASRTSNAIKVDIDLELKPTAEVLSPLAPRRDRLAEVPQIREGLLELLDLRHCGLMQLVSERNTSLGRVAKPSQRLIYELKILPELEHCILALRDDEQKAALTTKLSEYAQIKRAGYAPLLFNAIYQSDEMERHFSLGQPPLTPAEHGYISPLVETLERFQMLAELNQQVGWQTPEFTQQLESNFETLYSTDFGARWLSSMALLTQTLEQVSAAIEARLSGRPICFNRQQNAQSKILWNVFIKFYVGELQPYIAQVEREGRQWSELNMHILTPLSGVQTLSEIQPFFEMSETAAVWGPYLRARQRHTEAWQTLLEQCDLRPGA